MSNNEQLIPKDEHEAQLERESLMREIEVARAEMSTLNWCITAVEHALRSKDLRGNMDWILKEARDWVKYSEEQMTEASIRLQKMKEGEAYAE